MPKLVDHDGLRKRIRAAALVVFAARGAKGTGLAHVADELGIGRSSLYHYYPDKASLLADIARDLLAQEAAMFRAAVRNSGSPRQRLDALVASLAGVLHEWAAVGPALLDLRSISSRQFRLFYRRIRQDLAALVAEGQRSGQFTTRLEPDDAASLVIATIDGLLLQYMADKQAIPRRRPLREFLQWSIGRLLAP